MIVLVTGGRDHEQQADEQSAAVEGRLALIHLLPPATNPS